LTKVVGGNVSTEDAGGLLTLGTTVYKVMKDIPAAGDFELSKVLLSSAGVDLGYTIRVDGLVYRVVANDGASRVEFQAIESANIFTAPYSATEVTIGGNKYLLEFTDGLNKAKVKLTEAPRKVIPADANVQTLWADGKFYDVTAVEPANPNTEYRFTNVLNGGETFTTVNRRLEGQIGGATFIVEKDPSSGAISILKPRVKSEFRSTINSIAIYDEALGKDRIWEYTLSGNQITFTSPGVSNIQSNAAGTEVTFGSQKYTVKVLNTNTKEILLSAVIEEAQNLYDQMIEIAGVTYGMKTEMVSGVPAGHFTLHKADGSLAFKTIRDPE